MAGVMRTGYSLYGLLPSGRLDISSTGIKTMAKVTQLIETKQSPPDGTIVTYMQPHWAVKVRQPTHRQALNALVTLGDNQSH